MEDPAVDYFECTDAERAAFEAGIKLGSMYHQYVGAPVSPENADLLARAIEAGARLQPFVEEVRVRIDPVGTGASGAFPYRSLTGKMLNIEVRVRYREVIAVAAMRYERDLRYPLMRILEIRSSAADE
ncbi:MAG: dihydroneopterin aldolase family protein [Thermoplasmata archaeon]